jgi:hypothetical protein
MKLEYYLFLDEIRMISANVETLQESLNQKILKSMVFMEDLKVHIKCYDSLLMECK